MKALILYSQMAGYFHHCIQVLLKNTQVDDVLILAFRQVSVAPFVFETHEHLRIIYVDDFTSVEIEQLSLNYQPDIVYISGWFNPDYLRICRKFRAKQLPVVMGMDNQWKGTLRQRVGQLFFRLWFKKSISHAWVAGTFQYEFARKLGFKKREILFNLYAANVHSFNADWENTLAQKRQHYPPILLFTGRFVPEKGVDMLVRAFSEVNHQLEQPWTLRLVGNGPMKEQFRAVEHVEIVDFVQPNELAVLMRACGAFCLPSIHENWGVVLHEAAAAGLPIIASDTCGAAPAFVKHRYNGFQFRSGDEDDLKQQLIQLLSSSDETRLDMSIKSVQCAMQITPDMWAATFASVLR